MTFGHKKRGIIPMKKMYDWNSLWRELVAVKLHRRKKGFVAGQETDTWFSRARAFDKGVKRRWAKPDSSREFILSQLDADATVLDIGAGTGAWSALLAPHVQRITAVEPSKAMIEVMHQSLRTQGITNVNIIQGLWPDVSVEPHDFSLCAHAMYNYPDLPTFVLRMNACTRRTCFLLLRAPSVDGVMAEAARRIWKQPLDSPNFIVAYNILLQMGIYANVLMEDTGLWKPRTSASLEDALDDIKRHFALNRNTQHDKYLVQLLQRRLTFKGGLYVWPREMRSALVYWKI